MIVATDVMGAVMRRTLAIGVLSAMAAIPAAVPTAVQAQGAGTEWKACVDDSLLAYNECLMEGGSWFSLLLCDLAFEIDVVICSAEVYGKFKEAIAAEE